MHLLLFLGGSTLGLILAAIVIVGYFSPWIIAAKRNHPHREAIAFVNLMLAMADLSSLFLGAPWFSAGIGTIGWIVCMAWACLASANASMCWQCHGRLVGRPRVCPHCQARQSRSIVASAPSLPTMNAEDPDAWRRASDPVYAEEAATTEKRQAEFRKIVAQADTPMDEEVADMMRHT